MGTTMNNDSFNRAQANYDAMLPPDDSKREDAIEAIAEEIESDGERLSELVLENLQEGDEADKLAELYILLRNAYPAMNKLLNGVRSDALPQSDLDAGRALFRAIGNADAFIADMLTKEAEMELDRRIEQSLYDAEESRADW